MSIIDRIRELFGRKRSGAEYGATAAVAGGAVAATSRDDAGRDVEPEAGSGGFGGGESGGDGGGSGGGGDGGGGGGGGG